VIAPAPANCDLNEIAALLTLADPTSLEDSVTRLESFRAQLAVSAIDHGEGPKQLERLRRLALATHRFYADLLKVSDESLEIYSPSGPVSLRESRPVRDFEA
jgi:hypothetical protein